MVALTGELQGLHMFLLRSKKLSFLYSPDISTQHVIYKQRGFLWISDISEDCRMHGIWENEM